MNKFKKHIFICENKRPDGHPRGCCADEGSVELRQEFKAILKKRGLDEKIRANAAGCLDACEHGAVVVVYPEQIWYGNVKKEDVNEIIESHLINEKPVERLRIEPVE